jgi:outer membrane protein assembly complex protein YaeT
VTVVGGVGFRGNESIASGTLQASIRTTPPGGFIAFRWVGLGSRTRFNEREFRRDVLRIKAIYGVHGFPNASVDTIVQREENEVDVTFVIAEGEPLRVNSITISATRSIVPDHEVRASVPLARGDPFNRIEFQTGVSVIQGMYRDNGYPFVTVTGSFEQDTTAETVDVLYRIESGPRATIDSIEVVGNEAIDARVVLESMPLALGQQYSDEALYNSQVALYRTDLYRYVEVRMVDSVPSGPDSLVTVQVRVDLAEGPLRRGRVGAGYGTMDCFRTLGSVTLQNFTGGGRIVRLEGRASQIGTGDPLGAGLERSVCPGLANEDESRLKLNYNVTASLRDPLLFAGATTGTIALFAERHTEFRAYLYQTIGTNASITRQLGSAVTGTVEYSLSRGRTEAEPASFCAFLNVCSIEDTRVFTESRFRSVVSLGLTRNRANSLFNPTEGSVATVDLRWADNVIGSDSLIQFMRGEAGFASYHPLGERTTFAWRVRAGFVQAPVLALSAGDDRFIPPEERFYLGGPNSVRGFTQNELGPVVRVQDSVAEPDEERDIRTSAVGGDRMLLANVELRFPIPVSPFDLSGALFVDAGRLFGGTGEFDSWRITPGVGFRLGSPIGPVRLDIGYNPYPPIGGPLYTTQNGQLVVEPGNESYAPSIGNVLDRIRVHFSIGQAF